LNGIVAGRPEVCPYADRYAERVEAALAALPDRADGDACAAVGRTHRVCPYELALDRAATADVVIGDSNWVFEPGRRALADEPDWTVVVDEAHQLPDRASDALSPELSRAAVDGALAMIPAEGAWLAFARLAADISDAVDDAPLLTVGEVEGAAEPEAIVELDRRRWDDLRDRVDELAIDHAVLRLRAPLREDGGEDPWETLARATIRFVDALDRAGDETVALWRPLGLRLVNRDPSRVLGPRFGAVRSVVCTSATLTPTWFFRERCGLDPDRVDEHVVEPSFPPENRRVLTVPGVSTAYAKRDAHRESIVEILQKTVEAVPGNVALYFGSFDQLDDLLGDCAWPEREVLRQARGLSDEARAALLARMRDAADGRPRVLAAVLGGVFAEGVDLPGAALRAVVVVGPSLPPPSAELALRRAWWEERFDDGFDLSSIQPGMTRVVQAAGRVVRSADERGLVVLLCARFLQHAYAAYLPSWWDVHKARRPWIEAAEFFAGDPA
jgi:DNA excision repair protein ERCC-2